MPSAGPLFVQIFTSNSFSVSRCERFSSVSSSFPSSTYTSTASSRSSNPSDIRSASPCLSRTSTAIFFFAIPPPALTSEVHYPVRPRPAIERPGDSHDPDALHQVRFRHLLHAHGMGARQELHTRLAGLVEPRLERHPAPGLQLHLLGRALAE